MNKKELETARRIRGEKKLIKKSRENWYQTVQDPNNPLIFYFLIVGEIIKADYAGGYYIGKIVLPQEYPSKPGDFYMLTPNGRFKVDSKICVTISAFHSNEWNGIWNIVSMVKAFISIFEDDNEHGISHIVETPEQRRLKARQSIQYNRERHPNIAGLFTQYTKPDGSLRTIQEVDQLFAEEKEARRLKKAAKATPEQLNVMTNVQPMPSTAPPSNTEPVGTCVPDGKAKKTSNQVAEKSENDVSEVRKAVKRTAKKTLKKTKSSSSDEPARSKPIATNPGPAPKTARVIRAKKLN